MQITPFTFLIFDFIFECGVLSGATLISNVVLQNWMFTVQDYKTLTADVSKMHSNEAYLYFL